MNGTAVLSGKSDKEKYLIFVSILLILNLSIDFFSLAFPFQK